MRGYKRFGELNINDLTIENIQYCTTMKYGEKMSNILVVGKDVIYNGEKLPPVPTESKCSHVTTIDNHIYVNGFEWKNGRWERTLKAFWYYLFK